MGAGLERGLRFRVLGPLQVLRCGEPVRLGGERQRALLAVLLMHANELVRRDWLVEELFTEDVRDRANAAQAVVSRLRRVFHDGRSQDVLVTRPGGYILHAPASDLDAAQFELWLKQGRELLGEGRAGQAAERLREALGLWRGDALADVAFVDVLQPYIRRLEEARLSALEARVDADLELGRHGELIGELEALLGEEPTREPVAGQLMLALYRSGRQTDALKVYQRTRARLIDELGLEPGPALRILQQQVLEHAPTLAAPLQVPPDRAATARTTDAATRRVVTVVSVGISPPPGLDPEVLDGIMALCIDVARLPLSRHGGSLQQPLGSELVALFGLERVREDDALRAIRAAIEIRSGLAELLEQAPRIGLSTGLVLAGGTARGVAGEPLIEASRLQRLSRPGDILLTHETHGLVRDAVAVSPVASAAFRLDSFDPGAPAVRRRLDLPIVGRQRELSVLHEAWARAVGGSECILFTVLGEAGVGKSRLVAELFAGIANGATILRGRCLPYGEGITFWPVLEALTGVGGDDADRLRAILGSGGSGTPAELFLEVRRVLERRARMRPLILHVDDVQWAEPLLLDLLDHMVDLSRGAPILLLCAARPELLHQHPGWGGGRVNSITLPLRPLAARECEQLIDQLPGALGFEARSRVIAASEGNPLFVEEMVALIGERATVAVPPTIQALLAERLEGLTGDEREILAHGAVEGEVFHSGGVRALGADRPATAHDATLQALVHKQLIRPHAGALQGEEAFRFHHLLLRDAAYEAIPKASRTGLHERFAGWLESLSPEPVQRDELAGWHLEQAVRYQEELGRRADTSLRHRAAAHLHRAGRRAGRRGDVTAAVNLFERAAALAPDGDRLRPLIGVDLAVQLLWAGELTRAGELLTAWEHEPEVAAPAAVTRFEWLFRARPDEAMETIESRLPAVLEALAHAGDEQGIARAHMAAHQALNQRCHWAPAAEQARLAVEHARKAGDSDLRWRALGMYLGALVRGPEPAEVLARELDRLEREEEDPDLFVAQSVRINNMRSQLAGLEGRLADARRLSELALEAAQALGLPEMSAACDSFRAFMELDAGEPEAALVALQRCDANLASRNDHGNRSSIQAMLALTHELLGNRAAAVASLRWLEELGSPEEFTHVLTHRVRARLALSDRETAEAERWARSAVEHALRTDWLILQANARLDLAMILSGLGHHDEADKEAQAALGLFQAKGSRPGVMRAQALLGRQVDEPGSPASNHRTEATTTS
jgi:DNA-binding SARP family transcriptional activator